MTEPTRDALYTETLAWLDGARDHFALHNDQQAEIAKYAAECVRRVAELEAEVARLRDAMYDATLRLSNHPCGEAGCVASLDALHDALRDAADAGWIVVDETGNPRYSTRTHADADFFARRFGWTATRDTRPTSNAAATREGTDGAP